MVIAVIVLLIVTMFGAVAVTSSIQTNTSTRADASYKNAAEAAEAGLQTALYRMNMLNPAAQYCVGDSVTSPGSNGLCMSSSYTLGNGSTYQYYTTAVMGSGASCVGLTITSSDVTQRCITAVGNSNGAVARSQVRVAAFAAEPLFPVAGVIGLSSVTITGNGAVSGNAGSNGTVSLTGNGTSHGIVLGPAGTYTHTGNASGGSVSTLSSPMVLGAVNPGTSNQSSLSNCPARQAAGYPACNDDYRITNGLANPKVTPYDSSSGVSFDATTRTLTMAANSSLTLGGGIYNFCELDAAGNASITLATGVQTEIFIDSPDDPGSGCPSGTGNMKFSGNFTWFNQSGNPLALQLYVYGLNNGSGSISLTGNANFTGVLYAPQSTVTISGNGMLTGAIAGKSVTINGNGFNWDGRVSTLQATTTGLYYRSAWAQCSPVPPAGNPGGGCG